MKRSMQGGLLAAAPAAVTWVAWPEAPTVVAAEEPQPVATAPAPIATAVKAPPRTGCHFQRGDHRAWSVSLQASTQTTVPGANQPIDTGLMLRGRLEVEVREGRADGALLLGRLTQLSVTGASLQQGLDAAPFMVEVGTDCRLLAFGRSPSLSRAVARNQQSLLWSTQFVAASTDSFTMENGTGLAHGTLSVDDGSVVRTLTGYDRMWSGGASATDATMQATRMADGWLGKVELRETLSRTDGRSDSRMTLEPVTAATDVFTDADRMRETYVFENLLPWRPDSLVHRPETSFDRERRASVAKLTVDEAVDQFLTRTTSGRGIQQTWPELSAWFEVHPEGIAPALKRYDDGDFSDEATRDFFLALGKARVEPAREALLAIKRDTSRAPMDRVRAMFALGTRDDVGLSLAQELAFDAKVGGGQSKEDVFVSTESLLALSMQAGLSDDVAVQQVAVDAVSDVLRSQGTRVTLVPALAAVGNTGNPALLPDAVRWTQAPDRKTRRAAAAIFGRMPPAATRDLALSWLKRETDVVVRRAVYDAIQHQHFDQQLSADRALAEQALEDLPKMNTAVSRKPLVLLIARSEIAQEPAVRQALIAQARIELAQHSPLLKTFQSLLTQKEIGEVLR